MSDVLKSAKRKSLSLLQIRPHGTHSMPFSRQPIDRSTLQSESQVALVYEMETSRPGTSDTNHHDEPWQTNTDVYESKTTNDTITPEVQRATSDADKDVKKVEWVTGLKLWILMAPLCFTFFLVLLDISIIATVSGCHTSACPSSILIHLCRPYPRSLMTSALWQTSAGMVPHTNWRALRCSH